MKKYRVVIPYYYEFNIEANNKKEAVEKCSDEVGRMLEGDYGKAEVEEVAK